MHLGADPKPHMDTLVNGGFGGILFNFLFFFLSFLNQIFKLKKIKIKRFKDLDLKISLRSILLNQKI
jgi:hypothetical protein